MKISNIERSDFLNDTHWKLKEPIIGFIPLLKNLEQIMIMKEGDENARKAFLIEPSTEFIAITANKSPSLDNNDISKNLATIEVTKEMLR